MQFKNFFFCFFLLINEKGDFKKTYNSFFNFFIVKLFIIYLNLDFFLDEFSCRYDRSNNRIR